MPTIAQSFPTIRERLHYAFTIRFSLFGAYNVNGKIRYYFSFPRTPIWRRYIIITFQRKYILFLYHVRTMFLAQNAIRSVGLSLVIFDRITSPPPTIIIIIWNNFSVHSFYYLWTTCVNNIIYFTFIDIHLYKIASYIWT